MKEFKKKSNIIGRKFLEDEISNGFKNLGKIKYNIIQNALKWISLLTFEQTQEFLDNIFTQNETNKLVESYNQIISDSIEPRFKFSGKKIFLTRIVKTYKNFNFEYCDNRTVVASTHKGKFKILSFISASDKLYNVSCGHDVVSDNPELSGPFSLLGASNLFHGDCWKSEDIDPIIAYEDVIAVLEKSYDLLINDLLS